MASSRPPQPRGPSPSADGCPVCSTSGGAWNLPGLIEPGCIVSRRSTLPLSKNKQCLGQAPREEQFGTHRRRSAIKSLFPGAGYSRSLLASQFDDGLWSQRRAPPLDTVVHISLRIPLLDTSPVGLAPKTAFCHISLYRALGGSVMSKSVCSGSLTKLFLWGSCPVRHSTHAGM